jgi:hypothetical protein
LVEIIQGCSTKRTAPFSLFDFGSKFPWLRKIFALLPRQLHLKLVPHFGLLLRVKIEQQSGEHKIVDTWQDPSGKFSFISEAHYNPHDGFLYLGSFRPDVEFLARISWEAPLHH